VGKSQRGICVRICSDERSSKTEGEQTDGKRAWDKWVEVKESGDEDRRAGAFSVIDIAGWGGWVSQQFETKHRFKILWVKVYNFW
jgi:hypothetical protein